QCSLFAVNLNPKVKIIPATYNTFRRPGHARETKFDRALRRARKLRLRLGGDLADDEYPDKPSRMRWATYNRLLDKLRAADGVVDEQLRRVLISAQMSGFGG